MRVTLSQSLENARKQLSACVLMPSLEAEVLLAALLQKPRSYLYAHADEWLTEDVLHAFHQLLARRMQGEPLAYLLSVKEFWSLDLMVSPAVLIPRPETELLVETLLSRYAPDTCLKVADLGTGSGAIALALAKERPHWQIIATDVSESALQVASHNAQHLSLKNVSFYLGSWCTALPCHDFDVMVSNPPYLSEGEWPAYAEGLKYEPSLALLAGPDGLDAILEIASSARAYLKADGLLLFEHGFLQGAQVRNLLASLGYQHIHTLLDLENRERVTFGRNDR